MKALVREGVAVNVVETAQLPYCFHPDVASMFVTVPAQVRDGWRLIDGVWTAPPEPEPDTPVSPTA